MFEFLEDGWDMLVEGFEYLFSFEWVGDFWENLTGAFENIGEISWLAVAFGIMSAGIVFVLRKWMLTPFLQYYDPMGQILWGGITYVGCFVAGYLLGKYFENSS